MTLSRPRVDPRFLFAAFALLVVLGEVGVVRSEAMRRAPDLISGAVVVDLLLVVPLSFWVFCVRTGRARPQATWGVAGGGAAVAAALLPHPPAFLGVLRMVPVAAEIALLVWGVVAGRAFWTELRRLRRQSDDVLDNVHRALEAAPAMPVAARAIAAETVAFYYGLAVWRVPTPSGGGRFAYHEGLQALVALAMMATPAEAAVFHVLLRGWSPTAAWVATGLHIYSLIWVVAFYQAARLRPLEVHDDTLVVRWSLLWTGVVRRENVASVEVLSERPAAEPAALNVARLADRSVRVVLNEPIVLHGPLGLRREKQVLLLAPDRPEAFADALS